MEKKLGEFTINELKDMCPHKELIFVYDVCSYCLKKNFCSLKLIELFTMTENKIEVEE